MAATGPPMRRLRDVLHLQYDAGLPHRPIAQACTVGLGTASSVLTRAKATARPAALVNVSGASASGGFCGVDRWRDLRVHRGRHFESSCCAGEISDRTVQIARTGSRRGPWRVD